MPGKDEQILTLRHWANTSESKFQVHASQQDDLVEEEPDSLNEMQCDAEGQADWEDIPNNEGMDITEESHHFGHHLSSKNSCFKIGFSQYSALGLAIDEEEPG